ncbi:MAG TPA: phosphoadenylyl-sulfate reductase [Edaphocola sp.]|nr:phosphoadenylyl-sulfate reductase [Edaphocola sp.]
MNLGFQQKERQTLDLLQSELDGFRKSGRRVFATSSFQSQSVPLLHMLGNHFPEVGILFLDTRFLFPETYAFKETLAQRFHLNVITLQSTSSLEQQRETKSGLFQYALNPDRCCFINKVQPLDNFLKSGDVWISGVRRDQTSVRKMMNTLEENDKGILKFHPMLEWTNKDIHYYIQHYGLPQHPLEKEGYVSIGCIPCTYKWMGDEQRGGRWVGSKKTECGLHTGK